MSGLADTSERLEMRIYKTGSPFLKMCRLLRRRPVTLCLKGAGTVFTSEVQDEYQIGRG